MKKSLSKKTPDSLLGLSLNGGQIEIVQVRRADGKLLVVKTAEAPLALDLFKNEPELVGREIRNQLDAGGFRERHCTVCLPLDWVLVIQSKLPDLSEADLQSFLQIEAERSFPASYETLQIATSRFRSSGGEEYATQIAVPVSHLARLEKALAAAQLKPVSFSLGLPALQASFQNTGAATVALLVGRTTVDLEVSSESGVVALRSLEGAVTGEGGKQEIDADLISRELRITLGQLSRDLRDGIRILRIFGAGEALAELAEDFRETAKNLGLRVERVETFASSGSNLPLPPNTLISAPLALAGHRLINGDRFLEFLPPKASLWQQMQARYASKKLVPIGGALAAAAVLVIGLFLFQQWQLSRLQSEWSGMSAKVRELDDIQQQIRRFRPWFDESIPNLSILQRLTEAFPEEGVVTAKTVGIRNSSTVTCTGTASDNQALLKTLEQLRAIREVTHVKVEQVRGKPINFTFNFVWNPGATREN